MTEQQQAAMRQALEALILNCGGNTEGLGLEAITALRQALEQQPAAPVIPEDLDVRRILLNVTPGYGSGHEVYAKTIHDVVQVMTQMDERIEELEAALAAAPQQKDTP